MQGILRFLRQTTSNRRASGSLVGVRIILTACETREDALKIARRLVEERLVACVNVIPGVTSVYPWKGKIEEASEVLLVIKTTAGKVDEVYAELKKIHPYEVPEMVTIPVEHESDAYRDWMEHWIWRHQG